jgi:hypothetical protein
MQRETIIAQRALLRVQMQAQMQQVELDPRDHHQCHEFHLSNRWSNSQQLVAPRSQREQAAPVLASTLSLQALLQQ